MLAMRNGMERNKKILGVVGKSGESMTTQLEYQVAHFGQWRNDLIEAISSYQSWLEANNQLDPELSLRLYDLIESVKSDRLLLAFVAEFSRGKTELINSIFFADFKQRLLPSDVGRTTMCPTEIFYDPEEEPYIRLLPIETRLRDESIATFKRTPIEWITVRLHPESQKEMISALQTLSECKMVSRATAASLGLWNEGEPEMQDMVRDGDMVEIPAWRHALINYPHPLLQNGLVILDTPGLNALGSEPELTLNMIPNAHAVLFLLGVDTGVTKSDVEIWHRYVQKHVKHCLAVLNKIDILWDDLKTPDQVHAAIQKQREATARMLELPQENVLAVSAQKALLAKIKDDQHLLEKSGLPELEYFIANEIIPMKQQILRDAVVNEMGPLVESSRKAVQNQLASSQNEAKELELLSGKNTDVASKLLDKMRADKLLYDDTVKSFNNARGVISRQGKILMSTLRLDKLQSMLDKNRELIHDSWTTAGLTKAMHSLFRQLSRQFYKSQEHTKQIEGLVQTLYQRFHERYGFEKLSPPMPDWSRHQQAIERLMQKTEDFCRDPVNIMTEKRFLIKKFYISLVAEAYHLFELTRKENENWLRGVLAPLMAQIRDHKIHIERRLENIKKIHENIDTLASRTGDLKQWQYNLQRQNMIIDQILTKLQLNPPRNIASAKGKKAIERVSSI